MLLKREVTFYFIRSYKGSFKRAFILLFCTLISFFSITTSVFATTIVCKNEKAVRTLRTDKNPDGGCRAVYTKFGVDQVVGASLKPNGCDTILEGIRKTLESNVWKCKEVKAATLSELSE